MKKNYGKILLSATLLATALSACSNAKKAETSAVSSEKTTEATNEKASETEKAKETGKAVASARVTPAMQGELLSSADSIFDRDLEIFYGSLPSWNEIQDLLQYPTPPPGLYNRCVSSLFFLFNLAHFLNCGLLYVRNTCSLFQGQARWLKRQMFDTASNNSS